MDALRRLWRRFMELSPVSRLIVVTAIVVLGLVIAILRPAPRSAPTHVVTAAPSELPPVVQAPASSAPELPEVQRRAFKFKSRLDRKTMLAKLNEAGPFVWHEREGFYRGEYLSTAVVPGSIVRIFTLAPGEHLADIKVTADAPGQPADHKRAEKIVLERILPVIEASDPQPAPPFD